MKVILSEIDKKVALEDTQKMLQIVQAYEGEHGELSTKKIEEFPQVVEKEEGKEEHEELWLRIYLH